MKQTRLTNNLRQILTMVVMVVLFRIMYVDVYRHLQEVYGFQLGDNLLLFFDNIVAMLLTFGLDLLCVWQLSKRLSYVDNSQKRYWIDLALGVVVAAVSLLPIFWTEIWGGALTRHLWGRIAYTYLTVLLINVVFIALFDLLIYFRQSRQLLRREENNKLQAQYQYGLLKQQLNPHFLFNSLNILDYLVQTGEKQRASAFIHKLASVYRYMLRMEGQAVVELREEIAFVRQYIDLLTERFPQGLYVSIHVTDEDMQKSIVPLALQILIENATKHNVVNASQPLYITIADKDGALRVSNNLQPRLSASSTGVGLKNIDEQYKTLIGRGIQIDKTATTYAVVLPLIDNK